jgi:hypothetical protein
MENYVVSIKAVGKIIMKTKIMRMHVGIIKDSQFSMI